MVEHGCLVCYLQVKLSLKLSLKVSLQHQTSLGYKSNELWRDEISLHLISFTFDVSVAAVWQPITKGAMLVVGKPAAWLEPRYIEQVINEHNVTHMWAVPSPFSLMIQVCTRDDGRLSVPSLRELHLIGEALPLEMAKYALHNPHVSLNLPCILQVRAGYFHKGFISHYSLTVHGAAVCLWICDAGLCAWAARSVASG